MRVKNIQMNSTEIFIEFEKMALEWGKRHQIAKVGEVIISKLGGKRDKKLILSKVQVCVGRNEKTVHKTLAMQYIGRRLNAKGEYLDELGTGIPLAEFRTEDGRVFSFDENEVTETENDCGLTFVIDFEPECKLKYPNAFSSYAEPCFSFSYKR